MYADTIGLDPSQRLGTCQESDDRVMGLGTADA